MTGIQTQELDPIYCNVTHTRQETGQQFHQFDEEYLDLPTTNYLCSMYVPGRQNNTIELQFDPKLLGLGGIL